MKPGNNTRRWRAWLLAGALTLGAGALIARPAPAKPGFGRVSDEEREKQRAEQERRTDEKRQQEQQRDAERRAERERQTQERARQEQPRDAERQAQRERDRGSREAEQQRQAEQARQAQERARKEQPRDIERQAQRERQAAQERAARETAAREAQQRRAAEQETRARERGRSGFGVNDAALQVERERQARERARQEQLVAERQAERARQQQAEQDRARRAEQARADRLRAERERTERERATREDPARQAPRRPGFGLKDPQQTRREGSLDRYFNPRGGDVGGYRPDRSGERYRHEQTAYRHQGRYDRPDDSPYQNRHHPRFDNWRGRDDSLYDRVYIPIPVPVVIHERTEVVVREPEPQVVVVPERLPDSEATLQPPAAPGEPERRPSPSQLFARAVTLDQVIADIEQAWGAEDLDLLMRHVREDRPLEIYREGEFTTSLSWGQFRDKTRDAFERYETRAMDFGQPRILSDTEAVVSAEHQYREAGGREQRVRVIYALSQERGAWWIAGLDYLPLPVEAAVSRPRTAGVSPRVAAATAAPLALVAAPQLPWRALLARSSPALLATLQARPASARAVLYDLKVMRGIHPGTLAWALYRRGQGRPLEVGTLEPPPLRPGAWVAVRRASSPATPRGAQARLLSAGRPGPTLFPIRTLAGSTFLALTETTPPVRPNSKAKG